MSPLQHSPVPDLLALPAIYGKMQHECQFAATAHYSSTFLGGCITTCAIYRMYIFFYGVGRMAAFSHEKKAFPFDQNLTCNTI